jgi:pimeloyl-ACP methyl ester carboxylesterase
MPRANINGIKIDYRIEGKGDPLVMIAGFISAKNSWSFQTRLLKKYYRTITFDNRGSGKSDKPTGPYTIRMMADDTIGLMDHLDIEKAHFLGLSMGGMIAQELAINYPERVDKLVLASTFACIDDTSGLTLEASKRMGAHNRSLSKKVEIRRVVDTTFDLAFNKTFSRNLIVPLIRNMVRLSDTYIFNGLVGQRGAILAHDSADRLKLIKASTLVITGTNDRLVKPISSEVIANLVPYAKLVKVEGGSHVFNIEMRSEFNREVLDFLTK